MFKNRLEKSDSIHQRVSHWQTSTVRDSNSSSKVLQRQRRCLANDNGSVIQRVFPSFEDAMAKQHLKDTQWETLIRAVSEAVDRCKYFHATPTRNVKSILQTGLQKDFGGQNGASKGDANFVTESTGKVHFGSLSTAKSYEKYIQTGVHCGGGGAKRKPESAEILSLSLTMPEAERIQNDSDDRSGLTLDQDIDPISIRSEAPIMVGETTNADMIAHEMRSEREDYAIWTNLEPQAQQLLQQMFADWKTGLRVIKQALKCMRHPLFNMDGVPTAFPQANSQPPK